MNQTELPLDHQERINFSIQQGLGTTNWEPISLLSGGLSGVPIYKIKVDNQYYAIKLDNINDKNIDLKRCYSILDTVAKQGLAPPVYFTDAKRGIILMKYIDSKPRPESSPESVQRFAAVIRQLHNGAPFEKWKSVIEILNHFYQKLSPQYQEIKIIKQCMREISNLENYVSDRSDIRPCHCDLNPSNVLFDGENYFLIDWHAASPQNLFFDLACCATFFYFHDENLCADFLKYYFDREVTETENNKYYVMRIFTCIYYGIIFISISQEPDQYLNIPSDKDISQFPTYMEFMQSIGSGIRNLADTNTQQRFGFVFLNLAMKQIISSKYQKIINPNKPSHEQMIETVITFHFGQALKNVSRITIGICNEVYAVRLDDEEVIVRLSTENKFLMGSHDHIPKFKALGIKVPDILFEDYSKKLIPLAYQMQSKIEGKDLGDVIETLNDAQLKILAKEITIIFNKVKTIPASQKFGLIWGGGENELSDTWTERMKIWIAESVERGKKTGVLDNDMLSIANNLYEKYHSYFDSVLPVTYYGDICSKNVMIKDGKFNGLVDLDGLTQGDPLEAIGRIKLSWYGTHHGMVYSNSIMDELKLSEKERKIVTMYALLNQISWACENGIQFNLNTKAVVDKEKEQKDKEIIAAIKNELYLS